MIKYGLDTIEELKFIRFNYKIEVRDVNWVDVTLLPTLSEQTSLPADIEDFSILVITYHSGEIAQMVPQDIGCDCEYQLTFSEKEQVKTFINSDMLQQAINVAINESEYSH